MTAQKLDWSGLMQAGLRGLRLMPDEFWKLTPSELWLMLGDPADAKPMGRAQLDVLRAAWPDRESERNDGGR